MLGIPPTGAVAKLAAVTPPQVLLERRLLDMVSITSTSLHDAWVRLACNMYEHVANAQSIHLHAMRHAQVCVDVHFARDNVTCPVNSEAALWDGPRHLVEADLVLLTCTEDRARRFALRLASSCWRSSCRCICNPETDRSSEHGRMMHC